MTQPNLELMEALETMMDNCASFNDFISLLAEVWSAKGDNEPNEILSRVWDLRAAHLMRLTTAITIEIQYND